MILKFLVAESFYYLEAFSEKRFSIDIDPTDDIENVFYILLIYFIR